MSKDTASTRRSFLKRGALLAAPLAAVAAPAAILADDALKARLAKLENEAAIRELHQAWLRRINIDDNASARDAAAALFANREGAAFDPSVRRIAPDQAGEPDTIEVAADGKRADGRFHCAVEIETAIAQDSTLASNGARARQRLRSPDGAPRAESRVREVFRRVGDREGRVRASLSSSSRFPALPYNSPNGAVQKQAPTDREQAWRRSRVVLDWVCRGAEFSAVSLSRATQILLAC